MHPAFAVHLSQCFFLLTQFALNLQPSINYQAKLVLEKFLCFTQIQKMCKKESRLQSETSAKQCSPMWIYIPHKISRNSFSQCFVHLNPSQTIKKTAHLNVCHMLPDYIKSKFQHLAFYRVILSR